MSKLQEAGGGRAEVRPTLDPYMGAVIDQGLWWERLFEKDIVVEKEKGEGDGVIRWVVESEIGLGRIDRGSILRLSQPGNESQS